MRGTIVLLAAGLLLAPLPALASDPGAECDTLAGSPLDPGHQGDGVEFEMIDGANAEAACRAAIAAAPGNLRFVFQLGRSLDAQDKIDEARAAYRQAVDGGYAPAMLALGKLFELGLGSDVDYAAAAKLYGQAYDSGLKAAAGDLAYLHQEGLGFAADKTEAARLYAIAVEAGDPWAAVNLGLLYEHGDGVAKDLARAAVLYRQSAEKGNAVGQYDIGLMLATGRGLVRDDREAERWLKLSVDQDYTPAYLALARHYRYASEEVRNRDEAERLFLIATASGDADTAWRASNELAWMWAQSGERIDDAEEFARDALTKAPAADAERPAVLDTLAYIELRKGKLDDALATMTEAVRLRPDFAPFHDRLGDIHKALGKSEDARTEWQLALDLDPPAVNLAPDWNRAAVEQKLKAN